MELSSIELEERFNDYLDDRYGSFIVGWATYKASDVLYYVDNHSYEQQYGAWLVANNYREI